ncbi:hypothetical protein IFR05_010708, partial [Cadophora sp. M221]
AYLDKLFTRSRPRPRNDDSGFYYPVLQHEHPVRAPAPSQAQAEPAGAGAGDGNDLESASASTNTGSTLSYGSEESEEYFADDEIEEIEVVFGGEEDEGGDEEDYEDEDMGCGVCQWICSFLEWLRRGVCGL